MAGADSHHNLYMIVLALFTVGVLRILGVQLIVVHPLDDSAVRCAGDITIAVY